MSPRTLQNFIDGESRPPAEGQSVGLINPVTGEEFIQAPISTRPDVDAACQAALRAFETWRNTTPGERSVLLNKIADAIESRAEELVKLESENTGKPIQLTMSEESPPMIDRSGSSRRRHGCSRASPQPSTWPGTRRSSAASRSGYARR
jgi:betaine-aldehyde dehydrogenase